MQQITALHKAIDNLRSHATELVQRFKHADNDEETVRTGGIPLR
jgi:hypothetical protein